MEQTKEKKTYDTKYKLFLSEQDEYVPSTHLGMYSLFRNPENKSVYMSEARCQSMRYKTYHETMALFKKYRGAPAYCPFFNYNADILTKLRVNYFETHDKFAPIAELVEAFQRKVETDSVPAWAISFGIEKLTLKVYLKSLRDGTDFWANPPVSVIKRKKLQRKNRDFIMFGSEDTKMDYWKTLHMPRNPLYAQFLDWCELQNLRPSEGMLMAIECLLYARPAEGLKDVTEYDYIDELDVPLYAKPKTYSKTTKREVVLSGQICGLAEQIIDRYNREPKNIAHRIDFDLYCNNALHLMNQSMDLQYRDPALYDEKVILDDAEAYNDRLLSQTGKIPMTKRAEKALNKRNNRRKLKMEVVHTHTGKIYVDRNKQLEFLTVGDYGKENNIKADFLGLHKEIKGVKHHDVDLSQKWVATISTQKGCSMHCQFCDCPNFGFYGNVTRDELSYQIATILNGETTKATKRFNVHFARMGEPTWNAEVLKFAEYDLRKLVAKHIVADTIHPVISTMLPCSNNQLEQFILDWCRIKNDVYGGEAGLQFSINSTDNAQRIVQFSNMSLGLERISELSEKLPNPVGRKYTLNFAVTKETILDVERLSQLFDKNKFIVKITPIHKTVSAVKNKYNVTTEYTDYDVYREFERPLVASGWDVIVFVPSEEEDSDRITCGNALIHSDNKAKRNAV